MNNPPVYHVVNGALVPVIPQGQPQGQWVYQQYPTPAGPQQYQLVEYPAGPPQPAGYLASPPQPAGYPAGPPQPAGYPSGPRQYQPVGYPAGYPAGPPQPAGYPSGLRQYQPAGYPAGYPAGPPQPVGYPANSIYHQQTVQHVPRQQRLSGVPAPGGAVKGGIPPPMPEPKSYKIVCAIDFGTTYTGYVCSWTEDYRKDKLLMHARTWEMEDGTREKAPTIALFDPDMNLKYFGYEAEQKYAKLDPKEKKTWFLFQRFKMRLHNDTALDASATLKPYNRNDTQSALHVFSQVIGYLKDDAMKVANKRSQVDIGSIHWVLTVPAIWSDKAKIFMRTAAEKAGIHKEDLMLALEPEAAALYCRYKKSAEMEPLQSESKYMVADLGGGTVDVTVYRKCPNGALEELHTPTGGDWGGTTVDVAFKNVLVCILGGETVAEAEERFPGDMLDLQRSFENAKRHYVPSKTGKDIHVKFPAILGELLEKTTGQTITEYMANIGQSCEGISFIADKMAISEVRFQHLFADSKGNIIQHMDDLVTNNNIGTLDAIVLVGGYSEAGIIRGCFEEYFKNINIISPPNPSMAVLIGAALFGHEPLAISSRLCRYAYGVALTVPFRDGIHDSAHKIQMDGQFFCDNIFDIHLKKRERVGIGMHHVTKECRAPVNQSKAIVEVYASPEDKPPTYVTDPNCVRLGSSIIDLSDGLTDADPVFVQLQYAGTEMEVQVREGKTGKISRGKVEFMG